MKIRNFVFKVASVTDLVGSTLCVFVFCLAANGLHGKTNSDHKSFQEEYKGLEICVRLDPDNVKEPGLLISFKNTGEKPISLWQVGEPWIAKEKVRIIAIPRFSEATWMEVIPEVDYFAEGDIILPGKTIGGRLPLLYYIPKLPELLSRSNVVIYVQFSVLGNNDPGQVEGPFFGTILINQTSKK